MVIKYVFKHIMHGFCAYFMLMNNVEIDVVHYTIVRNNQSYGKQYKAEEEK